MEILINTENNEFSRVLREDVTPYGWERIVEIVGDIAPESGSRFDGAVFIPPTASVQVGSPNTALLVAPIAFKMLFTVQELVAIYALAKTDPVIDIFIKLVDDPRLPHVNLGLPWVLDAMAYLETTLPMAVGRKAQILANGVQP